MAPHGTPWNPMTPHDTLWQGHLPASQFSTTTPASMRPLPTPAPSPIKKPLLPGSPTQGGPGTEGKRRCERLGLGLGLGAHGLAPEGRIVLWRCITRATVSSCRLDRAPLWSTCSGAGSLGMAALGSAEPLPGVCRHLAHRRELLHSEGVLHTGGPHIAQRGGLHHGIWVLLAAQGGGATTGQQAGRMGCLGAAHGPWHMWGDMGTFPTARALR